MIRVFPRKTEATPTDELAFCSGPPLWKIEGHEVFVSCTFTYDKGKAEALAEQWRTGGYDVSVGGPAYDDQGGEFVPGRFVKDGMVITSRGCNNSCWFCKVPKREGSIRELEIKDGYNLLDNNLLQCSEGHIRSVFAMLNRQDRRNEKGKRLGVKFTGGLEALELKDWHVDLIAGLKPKPEVIYFAYDTPDDLEPLIEAARKMRAIGFNNPRIACYVLMGWPKDTVKDAQKRLQTVVDWGMMPYGMLYREQLVNTDPHWKKLQWIHTRPAATWTHYKGQFGQFFKNDKKVK